MTECWNLQSNWVLYSIDHYQQKDCIILITANILQEALLAPIVLHNLRAIGCGSCENGLRLAEKKPGEQYRHGKNEPHRGEPEGTDNPGSL